jgi:hypothetical protein
MFGGHVEVHSVAGDLAVSFGIPGLFLALFIAVTITRGLIHTWHTQSGWELFLGFSALWAIAFSPLPSAMATVVLAFMVSVSRLQDGANRLEGSPHP